MAVYDEAQGIWVPDSTLVTDSVVIRRTADNGGKWTLGDDGVTTTTVAINERREMQKARRLTGACSLRARMTERIQGKAVRPDADLPGDTDLHQGEWNWGEFDRYNK
jgi:hypothetical protein